MADTPQQARLNEPDGLLNRPIVMLALLFTIPASLVFIGYVYVINAGAPPGGDTVACERVIDDTLAFRIESYQFSAGLTRYEEQRFFASTDGGAAYEQIFSARVQNPSGVSCDENIQALDDETYLLWHRKTVALSPDAGASWRVQGVCDDPRPDGRCDTDALDFVTVEFTSPQDGRIEVREAVVDEYGVPQTSNGEVEVINRYTLTTDDTAAGWQLRE